MLDTIPMITFFMWTPMSPGPLSQIYYYDYPLCLDKPNILTQYKISLLSAVLMLCLNKGLGDHQ